MIGHWLDINEVTKLKSTQFHQDIIINSFKNNTDIFPEKGRQYGQRQTEKIKFLLTQLGLKNGYWVYANRLTEYQGFFEKQQINRNNKFKNKEWLYDLHWYKDSSDKYYTPVNFALAVECEWRNKRYLDKSGMAFSAVKYDFQKLLFSNADIKLMIFYSSSITNDDFFNLDLYFQDAINSFPCLNMNSPFLFICFQKNKIFYNEKFKEK